MGFVTKYNKYKFYYDGKHFNLDKRTINLRGQNIKEVIKRNRGKSIDDSELPLPINRVSRIVGVYRGKLRNMKHRPLFHPDYDTLNYLKDKHVDFERYMQNRDVKVFPGAWEYNNYNLVDMATDHEFKYGVRDIINGYFSRVDLDLRLPDLDDIKPEYLLGIRTKRDSYSGILTAQMFGQKRANSMRSTKPIAYTYMKHIMESEKQILDCSLLYVGGREKRMNVKFGEPKDLKTRVTLGQEDIPTLISTTLSKSLNEGFQNMDAGFNYGGRVNGRLNFRSLYDKLKVRTKGDINFNADFSGHDNNVSEEQIIAAFAFLRLCFKESKKIDRIFYYIMSGMIFKRIVLPESRFIYQISKGLATGHGMTNIITTLCSYGTFSTAILKSTNYAERERTFLTMAGDDVIGRLPVSIVTKVNNQLKYFSGMKVDDLEDNSGYVDSNEALHRNTFLKKKYAFGLLSWNEIELFINLSYPTSNKLSEFRRCDNYLQMSRQAPFDSVINNTMMNLTIFTLFEGVLQAVRSSELTKHQAPYFTNILRKLRQNTELYEVADLSKIPVKIIVPSEHEGTSYVELRRHITDRIVRFKDIIRKASSWMMTRREFKSMETVTRLKVFDYNKVYVKPRWYYSKGIIHNTYAQLLQHVDT